MGSNHGREIKHASGKDRAGIVLRIALQVVAVLPLDPATVFTVGSNDRIAQRRSARAVLSLDAPIAVFRKDRVFAHRLRLGVVRPDDVGKLLEGRAGKLELRASVEASLEVGLVIVKRRDRFFRHGNGFLGDIVPKHVIRFTVKPCLVRWMRLKP